MPPDNRDTRYKALILAVDLYGHRPQDDFDEGWAVLRTAGEFTRWLAAPTSPIGEAPMGFPWPGEVANELSGIRGELAMIRTELAVLNRKVNHMSDQQAELNVDVTNLTAVVTDVSDQTATLGTDLAAVAAEITALQAANPALDLSGLEGLIATAQGNQVTLDSTVASATALVPAAPVPPVTPPAPSV